MPDAHANFATSLVATAPSPATTGTSLVVTAAEGSRFPAVPFNAVICPADAQPTPANAEIVQVTAITTDTFTIVRTQESTSARTVVVGDRIYNAATAATFTSIERIPRDTVAANYDVVQADLGRLKDVTGTGGVVVTIKAVASGGPNPVSGGWFEVRKSNTTGATSVACTGAAVIRDPTTGATTTSVILGTYETVRFTETGDDIWTMTGRYDPDILAIGQLTSAADKLPYFTGSGTAALADFTTAGRALVDDADAAAQRTTLAAAPLASPTFTGTPAAPTPSASDNSTKLATTAYVDTASGLLVPKSTWTTKGDILAATAASTPTPVPIGTDNQVLTAASVVSYGVAWAVPPGTTLFNYFADAGNVTTGETDLYTDTIPSSTLTGNGMALEVVYAGNTVAHATATRTFRVYFAGTAIFTSAALVTATAANKWRIEATIMRQSNTVVRYSVQLMISRDATVAGAMYISQGSISSLNLNTTGYIAKITGTAAATGAATNDIVATLGAIRHFRQA